MKFTPKSETELAQGQLLPEGTYDFEVIAATEKTSKAGNEMIELKLKVFTPEGATRFVTDFLLTGDAFLPKLHAFCKAAGIIPAYEAGEVGAYDVQNVAGKVQIKIKPAGEYPAKNEVKWYGEPKAGKGDRATSDAAPATFKPSAPAPDLAEDDIPF